MKIYTRRSRVVVSAVCLTLLISVSAFAQKVSVAEEIQAVESGLLPAVSLKGQKSKTYNLDTRMKDYSVPGMSVAVVKDGKLAWAKGYGLANTETGQKVDTETMFQAGSISKPLAALAALILVEKGKVDLDTDVNKYLKTWKVPENEFTKDEKVTLRRLLTHTAGMTVHGFPGYSNSDAFPDDIKVLNGKGNTGKIVVDTIPGTKWRYSGGGYTVMERVVEDVSGMDFAEFTTKYVLKPLGMKNSTFAQPIPKSKQGNISAAFDGSGKQIKGLWHNYPEQAAAGLWTTPSDLAKYMIEMQRAFAGKSNKVLSQETVKKMLTKHKNNWGLGPMLRGDGESMTFGHGGKNAGFTNDMVGFVTKDGAVISMTNADRGGALNREFMRSVSKNYGWGIRKQRVMQPFQLDDKKAADFLGTYEMQQGGRTITAVFRFENGKYNLNAQGSDQVFHAIAENRFVQLEDGANIEFKRNAEGAVESMVYNGRFTLKRK